MFDGSPAPVPAPAPILIPVLSAAAAAPGAAALVAASPAAMASYRAAQAAQASAMADVATAQARVDADATTQAAILAASRQLPQGPYTLNCTACASDGTNLSCMCDDGTGTMVPATVGAASWPLADAGLQVHNCGGTLSWAPCPGVPQIPSTPGCPVGSSLATLTTGPFCVVAMPPGGLCPSGYARQVDGFCASIAQMKACPAGQTQTGTTTTTTCLVGATRQAVPIGTTTCPPGRAAASGLCYPPNEGPAETPAQTAARRAVAAADTDNLVTFFAAVNADAAALDAAQGALGQAETAVNQMVFEAALAGTTFAPSA